MVLKDKVRGSYGRTSGEIEFVTGISSVGLDVAIWMKSGINLEPLDRR